MPAPRLTARLGAALALLLAGAAMAAEPAPTFDVVRPDGHVVSLSLGSGDLAERQRVDARAHERDHRFDGVDLRRVLAAAGVAPVEGLKGPQLRRLLVLRAADGYAVVFAAAEIDATLGGRTVWIVDRADGRALADDEGPVRAVVPADRRPARWVRQLRRIEVFDLP